MPLNEKITSFSIISLILITGIYGPQFFKKEPLVCFEQPTNYIIYEIDGIYYAQEGHTGIYEYRGSIAENVINYALSYGGRVFLKSTDYQLTGSLYITESGTILEGEWVAVQYPYQIKESGLGYEDYDAMPTGVSGAILNISTPDTHALIVEGGLSGVTIKNLGIIFSNDGSGRGVSLEPGNRNLGMLYSSIENVIVWSVQEEYYSFYLENTLQCRFTDLWSFGGPAFHFASCSDDKAFGVDIMTRISARTDKDLNITKNIVEFLGTSMKYNHDLCVVTSLKIMDRAGMDGGKGSSLGWAFYMEYSNWNKFIGMNIEDPASNKLILIKDSKYNEFNPSLCYGGEIKHIGTIRCSYVGSGLLEYGDHGMSSNGVDDFIEETVLVCGPTSVKGFERN